MTYDLIQEQTLGSAAASVTFSNIPGTFKDLVLEVTNTKHSFAGTGAVSDIGIQFNSDTGTNYSLTDIQGNGSTASSGRVTNTTGVFTHWARASDEVGMWTAHIMSYANTNVNKTTLVRTAIPSARVGVLATLWRSTAAITSLNVVVSATYTMSAGTVIRLWGVAG